MYLSIYLDLHVYIMYVCMYLIYFPPFFHSSFCLCLSASLSLSLQSLFVSLHLNKHILYFDAMMYLYTYSTDLYLMIFSFTLGVKEYLRHPAYRGEVAFLPSKDEDNTPWDKKGCRIG